MSIYLDEAKLQTRLSVAADTAVPEGIDLWPAVREACESTSQGTGWHYRMLRSRAGQLTLVLMLFSVLGAVSYTAAPAVSKLFQFSETLRNIDSQGKAVELGIEQSSNGYRAVVQRAYADLNQVIVEFSTFNETTNEQLSPPNHVAELTLSDGTRLPTGQYNIGASGMSEVLGMSLPAGAQTSLLSFSTWPVAGSPDEIDLHLTIEINRPRGVPGQTNSDSTPVEGVVLAAGPSPEYETAATFEFAFTLPLNTGLELASGEQTAQTGDLSITLDRVVATLSETKVRLRFEGLTNSVPVVEIKTPDGKRHSVFASTGASTGIWEFHYDRSLSDQPGTWELTVKPDDSRALVYPTGTPTTGYIEEPITFEFEMAPPN